MARREDGFIRALVIIIIAILIISYFGINLRALVTSPTTKDNFSYVATSTVSVWNNYLKVPATYVWNEVFLNLLWKPALDNLKNVKWEAPLMTSSSTPNLLGQ